VAKRIIHAAAGQLGPIGRNETRTVVVKRLIEMLREAKARGCELVVFPETALTTFFPRWYMEDWSEVDRYFEAEMPGRETWPLFEEAKKLGVGFYLGYAELVREAQGVRRFNTSILVDGNGEIVGKYRKVHMPGHKELMPERAVQHLEARYFEPGDLGFPVFRAFDGIMGMCICYDRRWPETFRVMGLKGVEMVLVGYNTPAVNREAPEATHLKLFHSNLTMQAGAYQNGTWVVATAKAGNEDGHPMLGGSCIISPAGEIVASAYTLEDELVTARCDLDLGNYIKKTVFNFETYRRIDQYKLITEQTGICVPDGI
jgi:N-carbamoyl-D-amino-acid hydrolase